MSNEKISELNCIDERPGQPRMLDDTAVSTDPDLPPFLAKPEGEPVYHGFPIILETMTDGWYLGAITEYVDPDGCEEGDAYVVAPDGSRAGLVWDVGDGQLTEICPPDESRWGVYQYGLESQFEQPTTWLRASVRFTAIAGSLWPTLKGPNIILPIKIAQARHYY